MKWLRFILSHSIFIAFCGVAMAIQTAQLLHFADSFFVYGFIFFATLCSYNFYWLLSRFSFNTRKSIPQFLYKESLSSLIFIFSAIGLLVCFWKSALPFSVVIVACLLTFLYSMPVLPFHFFLFSRKAGVLKTLLLAFTWTYVTAFIPIHKNGLDLNHADLFMLSQRFLFMMILCIIFDSRDIAVDKIRGFRSLATELSPAVLQLLVYSLFMVLFATNFFSIYYGITRYQFLALQTSAIALGVVYFYSKKKQGYLFYYFIVDGLMIFSALTTSIAGI